MRLVCRRGFHSYLAAAGGVSSTHGKLAIAAKAPHVRTAKAMLDTLLPSSPSL